MALFSLQELDIAEDPYILLIKNRIMEKVTGLMGEFEQSIQQLLKEEDILLPKEVNILNGKISKGENYKYLPYIMLDYPAFFTKKDILAFRSMFYWGHFVSFTIHLQGKYCEQYGEELIDEFSDREDVCFCVNESPWEYLYKPNNYKAITELTKAEMLLHQNNNHFIKFSVHVPVSHLPDSSEPMLNFYKEALSVISLNNNREMGVI